MTTEKHLLANNFNEYASNPDKFASISGVPAEIAKRLPGFSDFGINGNMLVEAVRKAGPEKGPATPGWSEVMISYGHAAMTRGETAEKIGNAGMAEQAFLEASFWYFFARFPHIMHQEAAKAYQLHKQAYLKASQHFQYPAQLVEISFADKKVSAILRLPENMSEKVPLVMIWGGIDVWKSDLEVHYLANAFLKRNIGVLTIDMPGTGDCPIPLSKDAFAFHIAAFNFLQQHPSIDANRIGCYGFSFGGYFAVKLALVLPQLAAAIYNGGPIHYSFQKEWLSALPFHTKVALARVCQLNAVDTDHLIETLASLALNTEDHSTTLSQVPVLSINGEKDELVPIEELYFIPKLGITQDVLVFGDDRHVASRNWHLHEQFAAEWMMQKLRVQSARGCSKGAVSNDINERVPATL